MLCTSVSGIDELAQARMELGIPSKGRVDYRLGPALATLVRLALEMLFPARDGCAVGLDVRVRFRHGESTFFVGIDIATAQGEPIASVDSSPVYPPWPGTPTYRDAPSAAQSVSDQMDRVLAKLLWEVWKSEALRRHAAESGAAWRGPDATGIPSTPPGGVVVVQCDASQQCYATPSAEQVGAALAARGANVVASDALLRTVWPWLSGAGDAAEVKDALAAPWFAQRAAKAGVADIVAIEEWLKADDERGGIFCGGGYGGGGCLGLRWTDTTESARASVTRLATGNGPNEASITRTATTFVMPAFVLPIPIWIPQKTTLADELADRIRPLLGAPETK
jgi:hypothetical protein